ncbi:MAG: four helix bundle protein [Cytophagaceae bacterium]
MAFKFEQLKVWQKALDLTAEVNTLTKTFPEEELYILTSQIKRATDSIALNIAEGSTGQSNPEFRKFIGYSIRSGIEVVGCLHIAKRRNLMSEEDFNNFYNKSEEIIKMLQALRKSLN